MLKIFQKKSKNPPLDYHKVVATVHDQGSNMETFSQLMREEYKYSRNLTDKPDQTQIQQRLVLLFSLGLGLARMAVVATVHDQGSNMETFSQLMREEHKWESTNCAAHFIQLCR